MFLPSVDEAFPGQFTHGGRLELGEDGENNGFFEGEAKVAEVAHAAFNTDGVGLFPCIVWNAVRSACMDSGIADKGSLADLGICQRAC